MTSFLTLWHVCFVAVVVLASARQDGCLPDASHDHGSSNADELALLQGRLESGNVVKAQIHPRSFHSAKRTYAKDGRVAVSDTNVISDLPAFLVSIQFSFTICMFFMLCFVVAQYQYPIIYAYRAADKCPLYGIGRGLSWFSSQHEEDPETDADAPVKNKWAEPAWFRWIWASLGTTNREVERTSGLDAAMLLQLSHLAMELMLVLGLPIFVLMIPLYASLDGESYFLTRIVFGNVVFNSAVMSPMVVPNHRGPRLSQTQYGFWVVAIMVWFVVTYVQRALCRYQRSFIDRRIGWMIRMPAPRCQTVLVECIPDRSRTDEGIRKFFEDMFGAENIKNAFVVKRLEHSTLQKLITDYAHYDAWLHNVEFRMSRIMSDERPKTSNGKDLLQSLQDEREELEVKIYREQKRIELLAEWRPPFAAKNNSVENEEKRHEQRQLFSSSGFVTFHDRKQAELALCLTMSRDESEWILSVPPAPSDVRYRDLETSIGQTTTATFLGHLAMGSVLLGFMPVVVGISNISLIKARVPIVSKILVHTRLTSAANGLLQAIGLTIMMGKLPRFIMLVFRTFYTLKADRWAQVRLQEFYFWFLMLFVLLVPMISQGLRNILGGRAESPSRVFSNLAESVPLTIPFYLTYVLFQPATHFMSLTRYRNLAKYLYMETVCDRQRARDLSEPEDQDYHGMGSRNARFTLILNLGLIFGTICPMIHILVFINFAACRLVYGYLLPFAEKAKPDQGGEHLHKSLLHIHFGLLVYIVLMTCMLLARAPDHFPGVVTSVSIIWWYISYRTFKRVLHWEKLTFQEVHRTEKGDDQHREYAQPQLSWRPKRASEYAY